MDPYALPVSPNSEVAIFNGNAVLSGTGWQTWTKPIGKSQAMIIVIGGGGSGGTGVVATNSTAAGGGGGGGGAWTILDIPLAFLPPRLYISVSTIRHNSGVPTFVSTQPNTVNAHVIASAGGGGSGGNAIGATGGTAGPAGTAAGVAGMPLTWAFLRRALAGQAGGAGGTTGAAANLAYPLTGVRTSGGAGGGGLPAAATAGTNGGALTAPGQTLSDYPSQSGGVGSASTTTAADPGRHGYRVDTSIGGYLFFGGSGGASTNGSATGAGLTQAPGGDGGIGCGGGGMGGALTGSAVAGVSNGGAGMVMIICY